MKIQALIISIAILAIVYSPVLAISSSELISSHHTGISSSISTLNMFPSITTGTIPTDQATQIPFSSKDDSSILNLFSNKNNFATPTIKPIMTAIPTFETLKILSCPPSCPIGELSHCMCSCEAFECIDPETGQPYPMGMDMAGRLFIVKDGCPAKWADE